MNVYICTDHDGHWVGVASVVVASSEQVARGLLQIQLQEHGLDWRKPFTLRQIQTDYPQAIVLQNGDY